LKAPSYMATMFRFFALFLGGASLVLIWVTLESYYIKRLSFEYLMKFSIPATLVLLFGMVLTLMIFVAIRLRGMNYGEFAKLHDDAKPEHANSEHANAEYANAEYTNHDHVKSDHARLDSLLRLPIHLFWGTVAYGGVFIPVYHVVHYIVEGHSITQVDEYYRLNFLRSFLYEQTITLIAAIFHFSVARRLIRPLLMRLEYVEDGQRQFKSFLSMLTATFAGLLLVLQFSILWYIMVTIVKGEPFELRVLIGLVVLDLLFAVAMFILLSYQFRKELVILIQRIRDWLSMEQDQLRGHERAQAHNDADAGGRSTSYLPILSNDEVGQLALSFNHLQALVSREYEELEQELRLARQVQEQLMPQLDHINSNDMIELVKEEETSKPSVSNMFYDIIPWRHGYVAVIGSSALVGMPAALHISAAQLLLRAELDVVGDQLGSLQLEELLDQYVERLKEMFLHQDRVSQISMFSQGGEISLAMAVVDEQEQLLRCATLGEHAAIWSEATEELSHSELNWQYGDVITLCANDNSDKGAMKLRITHGLEGRSTNG